MHKEKWSTRLHERVMNITIKGVLKGGLLENTHILWQYQILNVVLHDSRMILAGAN
jgi:hypothetical protein